MVETVVVKDNHGRSELRLEPILAEKRTVYIEGEINMDRAMNFERQVHYLTSLDRRKDIKLIVNSNGGEIDAGLVIYDIIQSSIVPIKIYCIGHAYSMGAIILCCGRHGRYILPNSRVMIHEPLIVGGVGGKTSSIQTLANDLLKTKERMDNIIANHTGQPLARVAEATNKDNFFTAAEAVDFGICDKVVEFAEMMGE